MIKTLYLDTETTGLSPEKNSIFQIATIMEFDGLEVGRADIKFQPYENAEIEESALDKCRISVDDLLSYQEHSAGFVEFKKFLDTYVDKYNSNDKVYFAGYETKFDLDFLSNFFKINGDEYGLGPYLNWRRIDPLPFLHTLEWKGKIKLQNYKLSTVCQYYNIELNDAHNAMADIEATRSLIKKLFR